MTLFGPIGHFRVSNSTTTSMRSNGRSTSGGGVNGGLSVRQLLELERQLYQESIERVQAQQAALRLGSLEDFVLRCLPFEAERERELERAVVQLQLSQRNGLDLLQFELQAADDVFRDERRRLKRRLIAQTERRLRRIEARRSELQVAQASGPTPFRPEFVQEIKAQREEEQRRRQRVEMPSEVDGETLEQELEQVQRGTRKAFNFLHMQHAVPAPTRIVEDVAHALLDFSDRVAAVDAEPTDDNAPMGKVDDVWLDSQEVCSYADVEIVNSPTRPRESRRLAARV